MPKIPKKNRNEVYRLNKEIEAYRLMNDLGILAASLPQTAFFELSLERIMGLLGIDAGGLYVTDEINKTMRLEVFRSISPGLYEQCKTVPIVEGNVFHEALFTRRPIFIDRILTHRLTKKMPLASKRNDFVSLLIIPIFRHHELLGAILGFLKKKRSCSNDDLELYQQIVVPLAHALECSRLFNVITDEKRKLGTILYILNDGVCTVDSECKITFWNYAAEKLTGLKSIDVMGHDCFTIFMDELIDDKGNKCFESSVKLKEYIGEELTKKIEGFFKPKNGRKRIFVRLRISPYWQVRGQTSGFIITFEDATLQWEVGRLKEDWRSMLTHDLKTPLTSTFGSLRVLSESKSLSKRDKHLVDIGMQAYQQMLDLVNLYLDVEKFNAGKMSIVSRPFEINAVVQQCIQQAEIQAKIKRVELRLVAEKHFSVIGDNMLIVRVLDNLIGNAVKSILKGGTVTVLIAAHNGDCIRVSVSDSGIGIAPDELPNIFDRFYQGSRQAVKRSAGTGLGLTFCKQVIDAHGQGIWVESEPGKGSTFSFTLARS